MASHLRARWCAAALTHLVLSARDTAGLVVFDIEHRFKVPPGNGAAQLKTMLETLEKVTPAGPTRIGEVLNWLVRKLRRRGVVAIFSDFFDDTERIVDGLRRLVHGGHEPILFQVLDPQELAFEFDTLVKLEGLEGPGGAAVLFLPSGRIQAISTDYPFIKDFDPARVFPFTSLTSGALSTKDH